MDTFFSESTGLYFYSAVFQGNMALLALVGVFAVFRLQQLTLTADALRPTIALLTNIAHGRYDTPLTWAQPDNIEGIRAHIDELEKQLKEGKIREGMTEAAQLSRMKRDVVPRLNQYDEALDQKERTVKMMLLPFILTAIVIVVSLALLPFAHFLHTMIALESIMFGSVALLNVFSIGLNVRFVFRVLA